jgi:hypothetical protein
VENVSPILAPDKTQMLAHLELLFGRALNGRIEITGIHVDKDSPGRARTRFFAPDDLDAAVDFAAGLNAEGGRNVYVGVALRKDDVFPGKAADDNDFLRTYALWADADDEAQLESARVAYAAARTDPAYVVVTGRTPERRAQLWWPLEAPIDDIDTVRAAARGIAVALGTDKGVSTAKQLMRLAGTVSWPKPNKPGRVLERTELHRIDRAAREFTLEQVQRAFPPVAMDAEGGGQITDVEVVHAGALGLEERITDGREGYAFRLVRAHLREFIGTNGAEPTADELYRVVAPIYLAKVDQSRPGRGPSFLKEKVAEALRAFAGGQIPGLRNLDEAVQTWAQRHPSEGNDVPVEEGEPEERSSLPFSAAEFSGEPPERQWVVPDWIVQDAVNSLYGDGGLGKTLLAQQLACSAVLGAPWLGLPVTRTTAVLAILCEDDRGELHRRHHAIKAAMGHAIGNPFDGVFLWPRVGEDNILARWDRDGKPVAGPFAAMVVEQVRRLSPTLLILDTLADFYGGNEIDRGQVNYFVKTILGGLIKERVTAGGSLTVLLLGHPSVAGKASGSGYSGSTAWNAAVRSRIYLSRPEDGSSDERILTRGKANYAASGDETALRLFFAEGVLKAENDASDADSVLQGCKAEIVAKVDQAWRQGQPYAARKDHRRFIHSALPAALKSVGYGPELTRQAIRECIEDGRISVRNVHGKRGFKGADHD